MDRERLNRFVAHFQFLHCIFENSLIVFDEINPLEIKNVKQYFEMNDDCFFGSFLSSLLVGRVRNLFYYIIIPPRDG